MAGSAGSNRFSGFAHQEKPLKRLGHRLVINTRLKPGANERPDR
jgi:hypothetical protein